MLDCKIEKYLIDSFGLIDANGYKVLKITEGLSGADVYILEILKPKRHRYRGSYILKVINTSDKWYDSNNNEALKSEKVYDEASSFQKHLVKVEKKELIEDKLVLILSYAFKSEMSTVSLAQVRLDNKIDLLQQISYDLLAELNLGFIEYTDNCEMVESLCSYRINKDGNFVKRIKKYIYEWEKAAININGTVLPNPYFYIKKLTDILQGLPIQYIKGITHGDLHQKNILTMKDGKDYVVIDYDSCSKNYLLFDQAYLELNSYMDVFYEWNLELWMEGLRYAFSLKDEEKNSVEFAGVIGIEASIRKGIEKWYNEEIPNLIDSFHVQIQLARIAAGINYFSKSGIDNMVDHIKYLAYIGYGLKNLFTLIDYEWDEQDCSRLVNKEVNLNYAKNLWNECGKLRNEYIKILITDDEYDVCKYENLAKITEIDWRLIVDVGKKKTPNDLFTTIIPLIKEVNSIMFIERNESICLPTVGNTNLLPIKMSENISDFEHWKAVKQNFIPVMKAICGNEPLKSVLFILDLHTNYWVRSRFIEMLLEENLVRKGSRFICLGLNCSFQILEKEFEKNNLKYFEHTDMGLEDMVSVIEEYGIHRKRISEEIKLPSIDSLDGLLSKEVWNDYNSVVEIVYPGIERNMKDYTNGEEFYKGNEISWLDLTQKKI